MILKDCRKYEYKVDQVPMNSEVLMIWIDCE